MVNVAFSLTGDPIDSVCAPKRSRSAFWTSLALCCAAGALAGQEPGSISGRAYDVDSREPIADMQIRIAGTDLAAVTGSEGAFRIGEIPTGSEIVLVFQHVAYGTQSDTLSLRQGEAALLRISLATEAIALEPIVARVRSEDARRLRAAGSSLSVLTRQELEELTPGHRGLEGILDETIPGIRVSNRSTIPGARICMEFRGVAKSLRDAGRCHYPLVILDQARINRAAEIEALIDVLPVEEIHRIEMIPPAEAGVQYGTGSLYGVLVIQTRYGAQARREESPSPLPPGLRPPSTFNWNLDPDSHPVYRTLAATLLGNGAGLALGLWAGGQCIDYDRLHMDFFNSRCDGWATAGSRIAVLGLPILGSTLAARWAGRTERSQGRWKTAAGIAAMMLVPGYALSGSGLGQEGDGAEMVGKIMISIGVPFVTTVADHFFRSFRPVEGGRP